MLCHATVTQLTAATPVYDHAGLHITTVSQYEILNTDLLPDNFQGITIETISEIT